MLPVFSDFYTEIQVEVWFGSCRDDEISIFPFPAVPLFGCLPGHGFCCGSLELLEV